MTIAVRLRPEGEGDVDDAFAWYEEQWPGLGAGFLDEVVTTIATIAEALQIFPNVYRDTRRALTHRFPFGIYYRIESTEIVIVAVMHASRSPGRWMSRT